MKSKELDQRISDRICKHMNEDHSKTLIDFARVYGKIKKPKAVLMLKINQDELKLLVDDQEISIKLKNQVSDSETAHQTLVAMARSIK